jgi:mRNA-degrading endonuclease RelE of RelBE toxin-antitoxin system
MVNVVLTAEAVHDFSVLPTVITVRMRRLIARLRQWPDVSGIKHLKGNLAGKHRLRTGDYRLQFRVEETRQRLKLERVVKGKKVEQEQEVVHYRIIVEKAGHRDGFYDD